MNARPALAAGAALVACGALAQPAAAEKAVALTDNNAIMVFDTASPQNVSARSITGLGSNDRVLGIDSRPSNGKVYIVTIPGASSGQVVKTWTVDVATGAATAVGQTASAVTGVGDGDGGFDFNPVADHMRLAGTNHTNTRLNPNTGGIIAVDAGISPPGTTSVIGLANDRNVASPAATTTYLIDNDGDKLGILGGIDGSPSPTQGAVTELAPIGFTVSNLVEGGFDISPSGVGYAALVDDADDLVRLYTMKLPTAVTATPAATPVGPIFNGLTEVRGLTILHDDDGDGVLNTTDNCRDAPNADQANGDGDGGGNACDEDDDNDGISDAGEAAFGLNSGSGDSDGDGVADGADLCPKVAASTPSGCNENTNPPAQPSPGALEVAVAKLPKTVKLATLRSKGISFTVEPNMAASFLAELLGNKGLAKAKAGDMVLGEAKLASALGSRTMRIRVPSSLRKRLKRKAKLTVRVAATDAIGRVRLVAASVKIT